MDGILVDDEYAFSIISDDDVDTFSEFFEMGNITLFMSIDSRIVDMKKKTLYVIVPDYLLIDKPKIYLLLIFVKAHKIIKYVFDNYPEETAKFENLHEWIFYSKITYNNYDISDIIINERLKLFYSKSRNNDITASELTQILGDLRVLLKLCMSENLENIEYLLKRGFDCNSLDINIILELSRRFIGGNMTVYTKIFKLLFKYGLDPNYYKLHRCDNLGTVDPIVSIILENDPYAKIDIGICKKLPLLNVVLLYNSYFEYYNNEFNNLISCSKLITLLLEYGADPEMRDTVSHHGEKLNLNSIEIVDDFAIRQLLTTYALLNHGDPFSVCKYIQIQNFNNIMYVSSYGYKSILKKYLTYILEDTNSQLLDQINIQDEYGNTALHYAVTGSKSETIITELLNIRADPYIPNDKGLTPFDLLSSMPSNGGIDENIATIILLMLSQDPSNYLHTLVPDIRNYTKNYL